MPAYSVVIPCFNSSETIRKVVSATVEEFGRLGISEFEFVLVNDCSPDDMATKNAIFDLAREMPYVKAIDLGRNSGQHRAIMAGLNYAKGDIIISMDDDLQTRPSEIEKLKRKLDEGYDVVYGYYEKKKETLFRRVGSVVHHTTVQILMGKPKSLKTSSFWMIRKYVRDYAVEYTFPHVALQGIFLRITRNIACVPVEHFEREVGKSGYTIKKLLAQYANDLGFSTKLLAIVQYFGIGFSLVGLIGSLVVLIRKLANPTIALGWSSLAFLVCFFAGMILLGLAIIGVYLGRLYAGQTNEPQFVIREMSDERE